MHADISQPLEELVLRTQVDGIVDLYPAFLLEQVAKR